MDEEMKEFTVSEVETLELMEKSFRLSLSENSQNTAVY
jgi:hypothetical protein